MKAVAAGRAEMEVLDRLIQPELPTSNERKSAKYEPCVSDRGTG